jgi:cytochrome c-type biogenesis protein CcmH
MILATLILVLAPTFFAKADNLHDLSDEGVLRLEELDEDLRFGDIEPTVFKEMQKGIALEILQRRPYYKQTPSHKGKYTLSVGVLLVFLVSIPIYIETGSPDIGEFTSNNPEADISAPPATAAILLNRIKAKAYSEPTNKQAWESLARSSLMLGLTDEAAAAAKNLMTLDNESSQARLLFIEASIANENGVFASTIISMLDEIILEEPSNPLALAMRGLAYQQEGEIDQALMYLLRAHKNTPPESPLAQGLSGHLDTMNKDAPALLQVAPIDYPLVKIDMSPELVSKVDRNATVFITLHSVATPKVPLAAMKRPVSNLPIEFSLMEMTDMRSGAAITEQDAMKMKARVTNSGSTETKIGDLIGLSAPFEIQKTRKVQVIINQKQ